MPFFKPMEQEVKFSPWAGKKAIRIAIFQMLIYWLAYGFAISWLFSTEFRWPDDYGILHTLVFCLIVLVCINTYRNAVRYVVNERVFLTENSIQSRVGESRFDLLFSDIGKLVVIPGIAVMIYKKGKLRYPEKTLASLENPDELVATLSRYAPVEQMAVSKLRLRQVLGTLNSLISYVLGMFMLFSSSIPVVLPSFIYLMVSMLVLSVRGNLFPGNGERWPGIVTLVLMYAVLIGRFWWVWLHSTQH